MDTLVYMVGRTKIVMPTTFSLRDVTMNFATIYMLLLYT
jgi:hypothetical protein